MYVEEDVEGEYDFDEEYRQLSFYSIKDGGKIYVRNLVAWMVLVCECVGGYTLFWFWYFNQFDSFKSY